MENELFDLSHYPGNYYCLYHTILTVDKRRCEEVEVYRGEKMEDVENKRMEMIKNGTPSDTLIIYTRRKDWYDTGRKTTTTERPLCKIALWSEISRGRF